MEITKEVAINILQSRALVTEAGKYTAKVTSSSPYTREDGTKTTIVNFNLMTAYQADLAKKAFKEGNYDGAINNTSMTASQLQGQYVPSKGETVDLEIGWYTNKDGIDILVVQSVIARKAIAAKKFSLDLVEEPAEEQMV